MALAELELVRDAVTLTPAADKKTRRWKFDLAKEALKAKFPNGTKGFLTSQLIDQARNWLVEKHPADKISDDTIRAAAGRK